MAAVAYDRTRRVSIIEQAGDAVPYQIRGAVCWPIEVATPEGGIDVQGFALVAGRDIRNGIVRVLAEREFVAVTPILDPEGRIRYPGLAPWFNEMWARFFCRSYAYHQALDVHHRYLLQVVRDKSINPRPRFLEMDWRDTPQQTVWAHMKEQRLKMPKSSKVFQALPRAQKGGEDPAGIPALHALVCVLAAFDKHPYRQRITQ